MHRIITLIAILITSAARADITTDPSFDEGKWEVRYLHKASTGGMPTWKVAVIDDGGNPGKFLRIGGDPKAAGTVFLGQRVTLPDDLSLLTFSLDYQTFCNTADRSGSIDVGAYTLSAWDALPAEPEAADPSDAIFRQTVHSQGDDVRKWRHVDVPLSSQATSLTAHAGEEIVFAIIWNAWHEGTDEWAQFDNARLHLAEFVARRGDWPSSCYNDRPLVLTTQIASRDEPTAILRVREVGEDAWREIPMQPAGPGNLGTRYAARLADLPAGSVECQVSVKAGDHSMTSDPHAISLKDRPAHPHIFYSPGEIDAMRQRVAEHEWAAAIFTKIQAKADSWLEKTDKPPQVGGGWSHDYSCQECGARLKGDPDRPHEHLCPTCNEYRTGVKLDRVWIANLHGSFASAAADLGLVYAITGDERYARRGAQILLDYAQLYPTLPVNTGPAGRGRIMAQSLSECSWLLRVMTAYDLLYNALSVEERVTIEEDFIRPDVYDRFPYSFGLHNIQCWHNACYAAAGYLLGDDALIERSLSGNIGFYEQMKRGILDDGMWFERSMGYHYYTLSAIMLHCEAARHNGLNLHEDDKIKRMFLLPMRMSQPNLVPPSLSDQGYRSSRIAVDSIERALGWYGDDEFARVLAYMYATGSKRTSRAALDYGGDLPDQAEAPSLPSANLTGTGVAILRAGEGASARWALLRYGDHGGGHGHPDKLEIILYGLGQTLMPDLGNPGYGTKIHGGYYKTTPGHNTVTVGGNTQKGTTGQCLAFHGEGPFQVAVGESTGAYPDTTLRRTLVMGPGFLADVYRVEAPEPTQIDYVLRSFGELSISPDPTPTEGALGDEKGYRYMNHVSETAPVAGSWQAQWTLAKPEGGRVLVSGVLADDMKILHVDAPGVPGRERLGTLIIRKNAASATFAIVHQILAPGETPLAVAPAGSGIAIGGSDAIIILSPDLGPGQADEVRVLSHDGEELVVPISRP